jgi:hypothetical protein
MDATLFDFAAERLEHHASLDRLEARGTLRIALKSAGLAPNNLTGAQLQVVFEQVMPGELDSRGVSDIRDVCAAVLADLERSGGAAGDASATSPDDIFRRLAVG